MMNLEKHRLSFIAGGMTGERMKVEDLSYEETQLVFESFVKKLGGVDDVGDRTNEEYCRAYCDVLCSWGIMCNHPIAFREYKKGVRGVIKYSYDDFKYFFCPLCSSFCINR